MFGCGSIWICCPRPLCPKDWGYPQLLRGHGTLRVAMTLLYPMLCHLQHFIIWCNASALIGEEALAFCVFDGMHPASSCRHLQLEENSQQKTHKHTNQSDWIDLKAKLTYFQLFVFASLPALVHDSCLVHLHIGCHGRFRSYCKDWKMMKTILPCLFILPVMAIIIIILNDNIKLCWMHIPF